jgi:hypothetical protein
LEERLSIILDLKPYGSAYAVQQLSHGVLRHREFTNTKEIKVAMREATPASMTTTVVSLSPVPPEVDRA